MGKVLGIDYGTKEMGFAVSDDDQKQAFVFGSVVADECIAQVESMIAEQDLERIVLGLPLTMDGKEGPQTEAVRAFGDSLHELLNLEIAYVDERLSTKMFSMGKKTREQIGVDDHTLAAQEILQTYLDSKKNT